MDYQKHYEENKKQYKKDFENWISNFPQIQINLLYLHRVIKKEYGSNKSYETFKSDLLNYLKQLHKTNTPYQIQNLIQWYLVFDKTHRKKLLGFLQISNNLKVSYITDFERISVCI